MYILKKFNSYNVMIYSHKMIYWLQNTLYSIFYFVFEKLYTHINAYVHIYAFKNTFAYIYTMSTQCQ